jgi:hypothetical protein
MSSSKRQLETHSTWVMNATRCRDLSLPSFAKAGFRIGSSSAAVELEGGWDHTTWVMEACDTMSRKAFAAFLTNHISIERCNSYTYCNPPSLQQFLFYKQDMYFLLQNQSSHLLNVSLELCQLIQQDAFP